MSSKAFQLTGRKAGALKLLLDLAPKSVLNKLVAHTSRHGWFNSAWSEDTCADKKIYPGHQYPSKSKLWSARLKVTDESMELMVTRVHACHDNSPEYMRRKLDATAIHGSIETQSQPRPVWFSFLFNINMFDTTSF